MWAWFDTMRKSRLTCCSGITTASQRKDRGAREQRPRLSSGQVLDDSSLVFIYASLGIP